MKKLALAEAEEASKQVPQQVEMIDFPGGMPGDVAMTLK
jgi:hypothetical protein